MYIEPCRQPAGSIPWSPYYKTQLCPPSHLSRRLLYGLDKVCYIPRRCHLALPPLASQFGRPSSQHMAGNYSIELQHELQHSGGIRCFIREPCAASTVATTAATCGCGQRVLAFACLLLLACLLCLLALLAC